MFTTNSAKNPLIHSIIFIGVAVLCALVLSSSTTAQEDTVNLKEAHAIDTNDFGLLNPAGLAFSPAAGLFFVIEANTNTETKITMMTPFEESVGVVNLNNISMHDPINMTFDGWSNRLLLYDAISSELVEVTATSDGVLDPATSTINRRFKAGPYGLQDPRGMAIDPANGHLFILDSSAGQLVRIQPDAQGDFDAKAAQNEGRVALIDLNLTGLTDAQGLAFNPGNKHLYTFSPTEKKLYEFTTSGEEVDSFGTAATILNDPQAMVFAPSANSTDDPSIIHLFMADTGFQSGLSQAIASSNGADPSTLSKFKIYLPLLFRGDHQAVEPEPEPGRIIEFSLPSSSTSLTPKKADYEAHSIDTIDFGLRNPAGLTFSPEAKLFFVMEANSKAKIRITQMTPFESSDGTIEIDNPADSPINMTYDRVGTRVLLLDSTANELLEIKGGPDGVLNSGSKSINRRFKTKNYNLKNPQGMTIDPTNGHLVILDKGTKQFIRIEPDSEGGFDDEAAINEGRVTQVDLDPADAADAQGVAINPANGHHYYLSPSGKKLYETTATGEKVTSYDLSASNLVDPQALVFAPSADSTDDPSIIHLYVADTGLEPGNQKKGQPLGRIIEFDLNMPVGVSAAELGALAVIDQATLVRTTNTFLYSPPSPDPSGLAYLPNSNSLLISDGEVNEMPQYFTGVNLFRTNLSGSLVETLTTIDFSNEPTGVAYNPLNRHLYFSDDSGGDRGFYELNPGPDRLYNTQDDTSTIFLTGAFGGMDPEGIAYDTWQGHIFVVDGVNEEVYDIDPGANGIFDGVPPSGDDVMSQFDTTALGLRDPEGVEFDLDNGHLYVLSSRDELIAETTRDGTVLRYIDIGPINSTKAAGLAYAPSSQNPAARSLYIVDRGIDNNQDPNENDGKMYEISFPLMSGVRNQPPVVDAGADQSVTLPASTNLDGTISDDGLPNPPGIVTTVWSQVSGLGTVTFGDANAVDTTASFSEAGTYVLRLTSDDSQLSAFDEVTITVTSASGNQAPSVDAGSDQTITLSNNVTLVGMVTDDGLPNPPGIVTAIWSQVSGPGTVTFGDANAENTTASFSSPGTYVLRLTADDSNLTNFDEVTISVSLPFLTFRPSDDAHVKSTRASNNYGSEDHIRLRAGSTIYLGYLKFNVTGLGGSIKSAKLRLYVNDASSDGGAVYPVSNDYQGTSTPWSESGLTWNNAPTISGAPLSDPGAVDVGTWVEIDVSAAVTGEGVYSFGFDTTSSNSVYYSSKEGAHPPELMVQTNTTSPAPSPVAGFSGTPTSGNAPLNVNFSDESTNSPTSWNWDFGDGNSSTQQNPNHTYDTPGVYSVVMTVSNGYGSDSQTKLDYITVNTPPSPVAGFSGTPTSGNAPLNVNFSDESTNSPTSWNWDFGDGNSSTQQNPNHTYDTPGVYSVVLTVSNGYGSDSQTKLDYITVNTPPSPVAGFSGTPTSGNAPLNVNFSDESTNSPTSWNWDFGDGNSSTQQNPNHTYDTPGVYSVVLTASNSSGSDSQTKIDYITVNMPSASLTFSPSDDAHVKSTRASNNYGSEDHIRLRAGSTIYHGYLKFNVTGLGGSIKSAKLRLYVNDASSDGGAVYPVSNDYQGTSTPWSESGLTWNNAPTISGAPLSDPGAVDVGTWVEIDVSAAVTGEGVYSFGFDTTSSNSVYYSSKEGANPPQLVVQTNTTSPAPPVAGFSGTPTSGNASLNVNFSDESTNSPTSWNWDFGDGSSSTQQNPNHTYDTPGVYSVVMTASNGYGSDSKTKLDYITVNTPSPPVAGFSGTPTSGNASLNVNFSDESTNSPTSWNWDFGDGSSSTQQNPNHTYDTPGVYSVVLAASNGSGSDSKTKIDYITVNTPPASLTFSPSDDVHVKSNYPSNNYGSEDHIRLRAGSTIYHGYLKFNVTGLGGSIKSAKLRLYVNDASSDGGAVYPVSNNYQGMSTPWSESGLTWNNAPTISGAPLSDPGAVDVGTWVEIDVSAAVTGEGVYSFGFDSTSSNSVYYSSKEGANSPELVVVR